MQLQTREKRMLILLAVVAIGSGIILYNVYRPSENKMPPPPPVSKNQKTAAPASPPTRSSSSSSRPRGTTSTTGSNSGNQIVSFQEFERHSTAKDCWILMDGEVYDITEFLLTNEGLYKEATSFCGTVGFEEGFIKRNEVLKEKIEKETLKIGSIS